MAQMFAQASGTLGVAMVSYGGVLVGRFWRRRIIYSRRRRRLRGPPMKAGKSKKNSAVPSSADKKSVAPSKSKSRDVKALAAKSASRKTSKAVIAKSKVQVPKRAAEAAPAKTKIVARSKELKKEESVDVAPSMPTPIVKSAFKEETSTPGISPAAIPPAPIAVVPVVASSAKPIAATTAAPKPRTDRQPRPAPAEIPAILLEPDHVPTEPATAGPGARFALTPPIKHEASAAPSELPEAYGTQQIFLAARDPYCLFASWDLDAKQRARYNAASASGALTIRLRRGFADGAIELEVHAPPNSRDRFIEVTQPDTTFVAELGYHERNSGAWKRISVSKPATTPRDRMAPFILKNELAPSVEEPVAPPSEPEPPRKAEMPPRTEVNFESQPREIIFAAQEQWFARREPSQDPPRWQPGPEQPRWKAPAQLKWKPKKVAAPKWSAEKTKALDELISLEFRRMQQGSLEIEEVLRRRILRGAEEEQAPSSIEMAEEWEAEEIVAQALGLAQPAPSSLELAQRPVARKAFWFKVNAELIIYGSTEPDARVSIGGRPIRLWQDGSFSYRFALPDGAYELPVIAISRDGDHGRAAELRFSRDTRYSGDVGMHPQEAALKPPSPANL